MKQYRSPLEKTIQANIEADLGAEPDFLVLRNSVGEAVYPKKDGSEYHVPYGLGVGSPDLVGILRWQRRGVVRDARGSIFGHTKSLGPPLGIWLCLEVKIPGDDATPEQAKVHEIWRRFGALVYVVHSVEEARAALVEARKVLS